MNAPLRRRTDRPGFAVAVLGKGKAGGSLAASLKHAGVDVLVHARRLPEMLRTARWRRARVVFLAVPDDTIERIAITLAPTLDDPHAPSPHGEPPAPPLVVHMSGAKGPSALAALEAHGAVVGCFHPLASLDGKSPIPAEALVAVDARAGKAPQRATLAAIATLTLLAKRFGCKPARVLEDKRALYHAGAVVAGNLPVALLSMGAQLLEAAGVPAALARESLARLLASQAENAVHHPLAKALSGPVARGDAGTLARHLAVLAKEHRDIARVYRELSRALVDDVAAQGPKTRAKLRRALR